MHVCQNPRRIKKKMLDEFDKCQMMTVSASLTLSPSLTLAAGRDVSGHDGAETGGTDSAAAANRTAGPARSCGGGG
jgi:hypothetical protein